MTSTPEPTREDFDQAMRIGSFAADAVAIGFVGTPAQQTAAGVRRAVGSLMANGVLILTPRETWPEWIEADIRHPFEDDPTDEESPA